jgi:hypothetical protein
VFAYAANNNILCGGMWITGRTFVSSQRPEIAASCPDEPDDAPKNGTALRERRGKPAFNHDL